MVADENQKNEETAANSETPDANEAPSPETSAAHATFRKFMDVQQLMDALHHRHAKKGGPAADATRGRGRILALLQLKDGIATKDMAQILGIRVSSLNEVLAKLEKDDLVERVPSEADKRVMLVNLTEAGRAAKTPGDHLPDRLFAGFDEDDLGAFGGYLDRITANLEEELGGDAKEVLEQQRAARKAFLAESHEGHRGHGPRGGHGGKGHGPRGDAGHEPPHSHPHDGRPHGDDRWNDHRIDELIREELEQSGVLDRIRREIQGNDVQGGRGHGGHGGHNGHGGRGGHGAPGGRGRR